MDGHPWMFLCFVWCPEAKQNVHFAVLFLGVEKIEAWTQEELLQMNWIWPLKLKITCCPDSVIEQRKFNFLDFLDKLIKLSQQLETTLVWMNKQMNMADQLSLIFL